MRRRILFVLVMTTVVAAASGAYLYTQSGGTPPRFRTATVQRGPLTAAVSATGNLSAVITVQVGSQVSGQIRELFVDFNSQVARGQLIARIDPEMFEAKVSQVRAEVESAEANELNQRAQLERARADVDNARAALAAARAQTAKAQVALLDAARDLARKEDLFRKELIAQSDRDTAQALHDSSVAQLESARAQEQALLSAIRSAEAGQRVAEAQVRAAEANVRQRRAALQQAVVDLNHTFIRSPVDGVVVSRTVDVGQTVAASLSAPTLFTIAQDLTKMQIDTNVDEADIGRIEVGQSVTFTVDSFPGKTFPGQVVQIRKAPKSVQNVVTYNVVVAVENPSLQLLPGMTANVRVVVDTRADALKMPNTALRFRPLGEEPGPRSSATATAPGGADRRPGGGLRSAEETRALLVRELKLTEEQQTRLEPILEEARAQFLGLQRLPPEQRRAAGLRIREETRQKIRTLLGPEQQARYDQMPAGQPARAEGATGLPGRVWVLGPDGKPRPVPLRLGISDGSFTEVLEGEVRDGQEVLVGTIGPASAPRPTSSPGAAPRVRL